MLRYKSENIIVVKVLREDLFINISFHTPNTEKERILLIYTKTFENYFLENYKHLGINTTNVEDFITKKDPKYKLELEDVEKFLDKYLYDLE